ncbi:MAG: DUF2846 domain-containing protein, partial [Acidiferrobacterales bacterium]
MQIARGLTALLSLCLLFVVTPGILAADRVVIEYGYIAAHTEKKVSQVPADKALIYIIRPASYGMIVHSWTFADERFLGITDAKHYTYALVDPGEQVFWSISEGMDNTNISAIRMMVEAGKVYYLQQKMRVGMAQARTKLAVIDQPQAQQFLNKCKYVTPTTRASAKAQSYIARHYAKAKKKAKPY